MANLQTQNLRMVSWTEEIARQAMHDRDMLSKTLGAEIPEGFPNEPVRKHVLPTKLQHMQQDPNYGQWGGIIIHQADNIVIGSMGFKSPPNAQGVVEIGYDVIQKYQGHGYATEMAKELIRFAFTKTPVTRVTAECMTTNTASIRVLQKVGMTQTGTSDNLLLWSLDKADYLGALCGDEHITTRYRMGESKREMASLNLMTSERPR